MAKLRSDNPNSLFANDPKTGANSLNSPKDQAQKNKTAVDKETTTAQNKKSMDYYDPEV
ncbi:MAG: hypothetical protein FWC60_08210 [Firmicutes bacterium]|nr:hypothetical protein [Bacillota bacterium]